MRRCRYDHRPSKLSGRDSNPHLAVTDLTPSITGSSVVLKLEREVEVKVLRCLYRLGYLGSKCRGEGSNLHCHDADLSFSLCFSFALAGTRSLNRESVGAPPARLYSAGR